MTASWWRNGRFVALTTALLALLPVIWWPVAPLVDLPGHIGRYRILAEAGTGPLAGHYGVRWALIGNLGVDLLVLALGPLMDLEPAARLVVASIPALTALAMLWAGYEAHRRIPPGAWLALPLAYAWPFQFGFVNFCLSAALAVGGLAWRLRLARTRPAAWRVLAFAPFACLVWLCHSFGWAMLGLFVFGAEWRMGWARLGWRQAGMRAGLFCLPMALPVAAMLGGGDRLQGDTGDWFNMIAKAYWTATFLRERWIWWDVAGAALLLGAVWAAIRSRRLSFEPLLGVPALLGAVAFLLLPRLFQGGAYVDMRLLPYAVALALLAIRGDAEVERRLALVGAAFAAARMTGTTLAFALYAQGQARALEALPALPAGAAVLVLVDEPPGWEWSNPRFTHLAGLATSRRRVFTNEQWALSGQQLVHPLHPEAAPLDRDPSHLVYRAGVEPRSSDFDQAVATFNRCTFSHLWTIGFPAGRARAPDLRVVWSDGESAVYRVERGRCLSGAPRTR